MSTNTNISGTMRDTNKKDYHFHAHPFRDTKDLHRCSYTIAIHENIDMEFCNIHVCIYIYTLHISIGDMYKTYVYIYTHISNIKVLQNMAQLYLHCIMTSSVRHFWKMNLVDLMTAHERCALLRTPLPDLA